MVSKAEFRQIEQEYQQGRNRFGAIKSGDLVWEAVPRGMDIDYHPAVVLGVNVDECAVDVIDVTSNNQRKRYISFLTEAELASLTDLLPESIRQEHENYKSIVDAVKRGAIR